MSTALIDAKPKLSIYDSMSSTKRPFAPMIPSKVSMYVCGMTVYDYCHVGHARVMVAFDVISRWLRQLGYEVNYVRNITDIDDKIIDRAAQNNEPINEVTERFITAMTEDEHALGCQSPDQEPRATDYIGSMQQLIQTLVDNKYAYPADNGDVYFAVDKFEGYGKLSGRKLDEMQAGSRVDIESQKRNPFDFVLWKAAKPEEPQWASPWGQGRPGWHIECSAMATQCLADTFDIHGGGHDLQFPHHENEIAQSEASSGCEYARNWMHVGFINVDGEKMSKSLGNFFTIRDVMAKYHPETVRFFLLSSHYRSQINFSDSALDDAHNGLSRLYQAIKSVEQKEALVITEAQIASAYDSEAGEAFIAAMNDDFNSAQAVSVLFGVAREINKAMKLGDEASAKNQARVLKSLAKVLNILQLPAQQFLQAATTGGAADLSLSESDIEALIAQRSSAKADKDFAKADEIRETLKAAGVELEDSRSGTTWRRA